MSLTRWTASVGVLVILPASVLAQAKRPVTMMDLLDIPVLNDPPAVSRWSAGTVCPRGARLGCQRARQSHLASQFRWLIHDEDDER